jgi:hypothetical protein
MMLLQMSDPSIDAALKVIHKARTDQQVKLRFGTRQRQRVFLEGTIDRDHYRYKWVVDTRTEMVKLLGQAAKDFAAKHPYDCISLQDFLDVSESLLKVLRQADES